MLKSFYKSNNSDIVFKMAVNGWETPFFKVLYLIG